MGDVLPDLEFFMNEAVTEALKGKGHTAPNPVVGAVVVNPTGQIIGRGFHPKVGESHAEVFAINDALKTSADLSQCSIFVTLEPCNHHGRTPPCLDLIVKHKLKKVIVGSTDPNPQMAGSSIEKLKNLGVDVVSGVLQHQTDKLIRGFKSVLQTGLPYVTLKCAVSIDGKIATESGESKWITSEESRNYVYQLRKESDAVLVGIGTVLADDPNLDGRKKIILDSRLQTPPTSKVFKSNGGVIIYCDRNYSAQKRLALETVGAIVIPVDLNGAKLDLKKILLDLPSHKIQDVFVEGGATVLGGFLTEKLFDSLIYFIAPKIIGERGKSVFAGFNAETLSDSLMLKNMTVKNIGPDFILEASCSQA